MKKKSENISLKNKTVISTQKKEQVNSKEKNQTVIPTEHMIEKNHTETSEDYSIQYWHGIIQNNDIGLLSKFQTIIELLHQGSSGCQALDFEKLHGYNIYSCRTFKDKENSATRLLFTIIKQHGKQYLLLLDIIYNHDYERSKFLKPRVLKQFLEKNAQSLDIVVKKNFIKNDAKVLDDIKIEKIKKKSFKFKPIDYLHQQNTMIFSDEQKSVKNMPLPFIINGTAGSGKSSSAIYLLIEKLLQHQNGKDLPILYVTQSQKLCKTVEESFLNQPSIQNCVLTNIQFKSYEALLIELMAKSHPNKNYRLKTEKDYTDWLDAYIKKMNKKNKNTSDFKQKIGNLYQEFRHISSLKTLENYLISGRKNTLFLKKEDKERVFSAYESYQNYLMHHDLIDPCFHSISLKNQYSVIVVDESPDLSSYQLEMLYFLAQNRQIAFCVDINQSLIDIKSVRPFLEKLHWEHTKQKINIIQLSASFRCPPNIIEIANLFLRGKQSLVGGDKKELAQIKSSKPNIGQLCWLNMEQIFKNENDMVQAIYKKYGDSAGFVVVTCEKNQERVQKLFGKDIIVLNPITIKGLEFKTVLIFELFDQPNFRAACKRDYLSFDNTHKNRPKDNELDDEQFALDFNNAFVAITRATDQLLFWQTESHSIKKMLDPLKKLVMKSNHLAFNNISNLDPTTQEEWQERFDQLWDRKYYDNAQIIWIKHLGGTLETFEKKKQEAIHLNDSIDNKSKTASPTSSNEIISSDLPNNLYDISDQIIKTPEVIENPESMLTTSVDVAYWLKEIYEIFARTCEYVKQEEFQLGEEAPTSDEDRLFLIEDTMTLYHLNSEKKTIDLIEKTDNNRISYDNVMDFIKNNGKKTPQWMPIDILLEMIKITCCIPGKIKPIFDMLLSTAAGWDILFSEAISPAINDLSSTYSSVKKISLLQLIESCYPLMQGVIEAVLKNTACFDILQREYQISSNQESILMNALSQNSTYVRTIMKKLFSINDYLNILFKEWKNLNKDTTSFLYLLKKNEDNLLILTGELFKQNNWLKILFQEHTQHTQQNHKMLFSFLLEENAFSKNDLHSILIDLKDSLFYKNKSNPQSPFIYYFIKSSLGVSAVNTFILSYSYRVKNMSIEGLFGPSSSRQNHCLYIDRPKDIKELKNIYIFQPEINTLTYYDFDQNSHIVEITNLPRFNKVLSALYNYHKKSLKEFNEKQKTNIELFKKIEGQQKKEFKEKKDVLKQIKGNQKKPPLENKNMHVILVNNSLMKHAKINTNIINTSHIDNKLLLTHHEFRELIEENTVHNQNQPSLWQVFLRTKEEGHDALLANILRNNIDLINHLTCQVLLNPENESSIFNLLNLQYFKTFQIILEHHTNLIHHISSDDLYRVKLNNNLSVFYQIYQLENSYDILKFLYQNNKKLIEDLSIDILPDNDIVSENISEKNEIFKPSIFDLAQKQHFYIIELLFEIKTDLIKNIKPEMFWDPPGYWIYFFKNMNDVGDFSWYANNFVLVEQDNENPCKNQLYYVPEKNYEDEVTILKPKIFEFLLELFHTEVGPKMISVDSIEEWVKTSPILFKTNRLLLSVDQINSCFSVFVERPNKESLFSLFCRSEQGQRLLTMIFKENESLIGYMKEEILSSKIYHQEDYISLGRILSQSESGWQVLDLLQDKSKNEAVKAKINYLEMFYRSSFNDFKILYDNNTTHRSQEPIVIDKLFEKEKIEKIENIFYNYNTYTNQYIAEDHLTLFNDKSARKRSGLKKSEPEHDRIDDEDFINNYPHY